MPTVNSSENLRRLGDFEILREIGRGGMGVVYEARQVSLNRKVALKVLSGGLGLTPKAVQRFHREAEAAAKLHHTNIVPVYATGEQDGTHFYAMELIDGPSLDHVIRQMRASASGRREPAGDSPQPGASQPPLADLGMTGPYVEGASISGSPSGLSSSSLGSGSGYFDTLARMVAEVADALAYAHEQGVVHRDMKPSNLLLSPACRLSVNDFGLARMLEQPGMTMTGEFVGTPAYMSPEQITAGRTPLDHRTDIYSLGATLYELLTLHPPFTGDRRDQVLAQILHKEPKAPRKVNPKVPVDLETICLKAMEKDPDRRYQTARAMADDLRRYVNRFAISARRAGPVERLRKWVKRRPALAAALAGIALAIGLAGFFAYQAYLAKEQRRADQERHDAELQAERRQRALDDAVAAALTGDLERADKAIRAAELQGASTGQVRLLRGLVHFQRSDVQMAIADLEQAAQLLPDSVAARALLMIFYERAGQRAKCIPLASELERMEPVTPEDYLFRGYQRVRNDPDGAVQSLDAAVRRRDSPVARAIRAEARALRALEWTDRPEAERAREDARIARGLLPDNPFVLAASAQAHLAAAFLYQESGEREKRLSALAEMEHNVRALERFDQFPGGGFYRSLHYEQIGKETAATESLRLAADRQGTNAALFHYAADLSRHGESEKALELLARRREKGDNRGDLLRAFLLAERKEDGPAQAYEANKEFLRNHQSLGTQLAEASVLLLLGRKAEAQEVVRGIPVADKPILGGSVFKDREFAQRLWMYASGESPSEEELLQSVKGSRINRLRAHWYIGMTHLSQGDRGRAKHHFRQAVETRSYLEITCTLSRLMLARLEKDLAWPPWIPLKTK